MVLLEVTEVGLKEPWNFACHCQVQVYSGKGSGQVWTETDEGEEQRLDKGIGRQCPQYGERGHSAAGSTQMTTKS